MNFAQVLRRSSRLDPSGTVLLHGERRVDYLALDMAAQRVATILGRHHGIAPGDRVAMLMPDTPELAFAAYGILWAGAVLCTLDPETDPDTLVGALKTVGAKLLIGWHALAEVVEHLSGALDTDWLLVEPREFSRLLAATPPRAPLADVAGDAPAVVLGLTPFLELGHTELAIRARQAADQAGLAPGVVVAPPPSLSNPVDQIRTLHAGVQAGAALSLPATPLIAVKESSWR